MTWRLIRRKPDLIITDWRQWWKEVIEHNLRVKNFEARNGNFETSAVVKNHRVKQREQRSQGECWQWKANGQCSKGDKRAKSTQPNHSPRSSAQQNVKNASRTRSPRGRSPSGKMARLPCKDHLKGTCTTPLCEEWHPPECLFYKSEKDADLAKSACICTDRLKNSLAKGPKRMVTKVQWRCWRRMNKIIERWDPLYTITHQIHDNWVAYSRIWSRRSLHRFYGRAQTYWSQSDV